MATQLSQTQMVIWPRQVDFRVSKVQDLDLVSAVDS